MTFKQFLLNIPVVKSDYPFITIADIIEFFLTVITYTQLNQLVDLGNFIERIKHDARMTVIKIFIGFTQVTMCVYLKYSKFSVFFSNRFQITQRNAVIATEQDDQLIIQQQAFGLFINPFIQVGTSFIYFFKRFTHETVLLNFFAL